MCSKEIVYFKKFGPVNTDEVIRLARIRAEELGIKHVVVASNTGETGVKTCEAFRDHNVVVVTHQVGHAKPGFLELKRELKEKIEKMGGCIFTGTHALSAVERSVRRTLRTWLPLELMANALRLLGEGIKVCIEIAVMAADAGLIPVDEEVITIGGTGRGADTSAVINPAHSNNFFDLEVREIICKPRVRRLGSSLGY